MAAAPLEPTKAAFWTMIYRERPASGMELCLVLSQTDGQSISVSRARSPGQSTTWMMGVGVNKHPGRSQFLLIDQRRFSTSDEVFVERESAVIVAALKRGKTFAVEWTKWPGTLMEGQYTIGNFAAVAAECEAKLP